MASKDWQGTFATSRESLHRVETRLNLARRALTKADMSSPVRHAVDALDSDNSPCDARRLARGDGR